MNPQKLKDTIISLSSANTFEDAIQEWKNRKSYFVPYGDKSCLCDHAIAEVCVLYNSGTNQLAEVGNCCVKKFLSKESSHKVFEGIKRLKENPFSSKASTSVLEYSREHLFINDWELSFLKDLGGKRKISDKQAKTKAKIHYKIVSGFYAQTQDKVIEKPKLRNK